ncbi:NAD-dependent epimerase/dehydratase family protein [Nocardioides mangrovicus]|uniref:NAD-dependent epimerase/dehydratase family protein n=1 Tax=Nocardioides mangrovicus TaxID=2478913 RepID=A0A3L8NZ57_9ACTN|nr:NAD-dependent epimerase/dehydratase family protein [Nocardioides mangrovicus]RLV48184.1 NAD-dependent epimerase/dehydratase family protein [Nocardioides mangrovicus]
MRIMVLGGDGYLGWPTAMYLSAQGHDVAVLDNAVRRQYDEELGSGSLVPIVSLHERVRAWREVSGREIELWFGDLCDADFCYAAVSGFRPDAVVHFAEQRAAPYSMIDRKHAVYTQTNNVVGTLNLMYAVGEVDRDIHIVKLGTMGEYGQPNIDIEEGWLEVEHKGRKDRVLFPKKPGSFYHLSKVHDSHNLEFGCRIWGLRVTDLNQGVVYGQETEQTVLDPRLATRLDYDAVFGTVLNRFAIQAVLGLPLSVYGNGTQTRAYLDIRDTVRCIEIACENPADAGEFRVFNQATEQFSLDELAKLVANSFPGGAEIEHVDNPRVEIEDHYYKFVHTALESLGLQPHYLGDTLLEQMYGVIEQHRGRVNTDLLAASGINWRTSANAAPR